MSSERVFGEDFISINSLTVDNIASTTRAIGEFGGRDDEDVDTWLEAAEVLAIALELSEKEVRRAVILGLRGRQNHCSLTFSVNNLKRLGEL